MNSHSMTQGLIGSGTQMFTMLRFCIAVLTSFVFKRKQRVANNSYNCRFHRQRQNGYL